MTARKTDNTIYYSGEIKARKPANAIFNIDTIGLGFQPGDTIIVDAADFDVAGTASNLSGQYVITKVNEGSTTTDIVVNAAHATEVAPAWANIGSSNVGAVSGAVSD
jgi:FMN phosphatase YigB (HAD superfamily)